LCDTYELVSELWDAYELVCWTVWHIWTHLWTVRHIWISLSKCVTHMTWSGCPWVVAVSCSCDQFILHMAGCNKQQHVATRLNRCVFMLMSHTYTPEWVMLYVWMSVSHTWMRRVTTERHLKDVTHKVMSSQHTATHTATHCNTLQHTLQHTVYTRCHA